MLIELKNFKSWNANSFVIPDDGITLISGKSGSGKTSIFDAIQFVLFSKGQKLVSFGKSSCTVKMDFKNLSITRTKRPNQLIVQSKGCQYEGDVAQQLINSEFGKDFEFISVLRQNQEKSFIHQSPADKLAFIECFAFHDLDMTMIKKHIKDKIKIKQQYLSDIQSKEQVFENIIKEVYVSPDMLSSRAKHQWETNEMDYLKLQPRIAEDEKIQELHRQIATEKETIDVLRKRKTDYENYLKYQNFMVEMEDIQSTILSLERDVVDFEEVESKIKAFNDFQKFKKIQGDCEEEKNKIVLCWENMSKAQCQKGLEQVKSLHQKLKWLHDVSSNHKSIKEWLGSNDKELLASQAEIMKKEIEDLKQSIKIDDIYECPSCFIKLEIQNSKLVAISNELLSSWTNISTIKIRNEKLKQKEREFEKNANMRQKIDAKQQEFEMLDKMIKDQCEASFEFVNMDELTQKIKTFQKIMDDNCAIEQNNELIQCKITQFELFLKTYPESFYSLNESDHHFTDIQKKYEEMINIQKKIRDCQNKKQFVHGQIASLGQVENAQEEKYDDLIQFHHKCIQRLESLIQLEKDNEKVNEELKRFAEKFAFYQKQKTMMEELKTDEKKNQIDLQSILSFEDMVKKVEQRCLNEMIECINNHVQRYLDEFFVDNNIVCRLESTKKLKKAEKFEINTRFVYKGNECDFNSLSGGEKDRISLAFTLSFSEIASSPFILLDECINSLDQESAEFIIHATKQLYHSKPILFVGHQMVSGLFDQVISL